jgi:hypothetical protein
MSHSYILVLFFKLVSNCALLPILIYFYFEGLAKAISAISLLGNIFVKKD